MIATITLNPCIDKTMVIEGFTYGGLNRVVATRQDVSGKGINVAKAASALGMEVMCGGFNFTRNKTLLENELESLGILYDFVDVEGSVRTNVKIVEQNSRVMTEVNERGDHTDDKYVDQLLWKLEGMPADVFVLSGSVPPGVGKDVYRRIIERLPGRRFVLDADGECLTEGLKASPEVIKPNLYELESAFGVKLSSHRDILRLCREIVAKGVKLVCVSMGQDGAMIVDREDAFFAPALPIAVKGVQGAGDSLVAGICKAMTEGVGPREALRYAVAAAGGSLVREGTLMCTAAGFAEMLPLVEPVKVE